MNLGGYGRFLEYLGKRETFHLPGNSQGLGNFWRLSASFSARPVSPSKDEGSACSLTNVPDIQPARKTVSRSACFDYRHGIWDSFFVLRWRNHLHNDSTHFFTLTTFVAIVNGLKTLRERDA